VHADDQGARSYNAIFPLFSKDDQIPFNNLQEFQAAVEIGNRGWLSSAASQLVENSTNTGWQFRLARMLRSADYASGH
jgi:hypothetical protein